MRYFFDTEFLESTGSGQSRIQLISIGIVAEDGNELYLENSGFDWGQDMDPWLHENVEPHLLGPGSGAWCSVGEMATRIEEFVGDEPELWAYVAAYDWIALISVFGRLIDRPEGWPIYCRDLKQEIQRRGLSKDDLPAQEGQEHLAIADARHNLIIWRSLEGVH